MKNTQLVLLTLPITLLLPSLQGQTVTYNSDTTLTTSIEVGNTSDIYAVVVDGSSVLTFGTGGSVAFNNNGSVSSDGIWTVGLRLNTGSGLVMQQGSITVDDAGNTGPSNLPNQSGTGNDVVVGVQLNGNNTLDVGGSASINLASSGGVRSGQLFRVGSNNSTLNISGGTFVSYETSASSSNNTVFNLGGSGNVVNISGGTFELGASASTGGGTFFYFGSNVDVILSGGTFVETVGTNYQGIDFATSDGSFNFLGKQLELDTDQDGSFETIISTDTSVSDLAGDFRITFQDESTWESNYLQKVAGQISFTAIPEPSVSSALVGIGALSLIVLRRNRS